MTEQLSVQARINSLKEFLENQKKNQIAETELVTEVGLMGQLQLMNKQLAVNNEFQDLARIRFEKANAVSGDINVHDWNEVVLPSGSQVIFSFIIPESWVLHIRECSITYNPLSTYDFIRDGRYEPIMSEFYNDWADHPLIFSPPIRAYSTCIITALNLSGQDQIYSCFFGGFLRRYRRVGELITEETSLIEKSIGD